MDTLSRLVDKDPWLLQVLLVLILLLLVLVAVLFVFAMRQGREVSFWQLKIGPKPVVDTVATGLAEPATPTETAFGIVRYERTSHALDNVKMHCLHEATEIWLIGATMHYSLGNLKQLLIERVQEGASLHILVADPMGEDFGASARGFNQTTIELHRESMITLNACHDVLTTIDRTPISKGSVHVKLFDRVFAAGVYFFDPRSTTATMILVPHIFGYDAPLSPGLLVKRAKSGLLEDYFAFYNRVWNRAMPFEAWITKHPTYLTSPRAAD